MSAQAKETRRGVVKTSISMREDLFLWATARARRLGYETFSAYLAHLVHNDRVSAGQSLTIQEQASEYKTELSKVAKR